MFRNPVTDLIVVVVVALLIFGPKRLPLLGRALGQGLREFKEGISGDSKSAHEEERPALTPAAGEPATSSSAAPADPQPVPSAAPSSATPSSEPGSASAERRS